MCWSCPCTIVSIGCQQISYDFGKIKLSHGNRVYHFLLALSSIFSTSSTHLCVYVDIGVGNCPLYNKMVSIYLITMV